MMNARPSILSQAPAGLCGFKAFRKAVWTLCVLLSLTAICYAAEEDSKGKDSIETLLKRAKAGDPAAEWQLGLYCMDGVSLDGVG